MTPAYAYLHGYVVGIVIGLVVLGMRAVARRVSGWEPRK